MKYFRIFNNHSEYEDFRGSKDYPQFNISICLEEEDVHISEPKKEDYSEKYLTFVAVEPSTFSFTSNEIEYSLDNGATWSTLSVGSSTEEVGVGEEIMFKGNITSGGTTGYGIGTFSSSGKFNVEGNIMSLIYGDDFIDKTTIKSRNFESMFYQNENIVNAENLVLPSETMASYCCLRMFGGYSNLETVPELPATTCESSVIYGEDNGIVSVKPNLATSAKTISGTYHDSLRSIDISYNLTQEGQTEKPYSQRYLTFDVLTGGTIYWLARNNVAKTISYSINNGEWTEITASSTGTPITVSSGDKVTVESGNISDTFTFE